MKIHDAARNGDIAGGAGELTAGVAADEPEYPSGVGCPAGPTALDAVCVLLHADRNMVLFLIPIDSAGPQGEMHTVIVGDGVQIAMQPGPCRVEMVLLYLPENGATIVRSRGVIDPARKRQGDRPRIFRSRSG